MPDSGALVGRASALLLDRPPGLGSTRLGVVDGPSGSGKTTFALAWERHLRAQGAAVLVFSSDLLATWTDPFGWFDRFDRQVLTPIAGGRPGRIRLTDWTGGEPVPGGWFDVPVPEVLILEGVSSARSALHGRASVTVWVQVGDRAERLERAVARDGEPSRHFLTAWQDAEDAFFAADGTRDRADLVLRSVLGDPTVDSRVATSPSTTDPAVTSKATTVPATTHPATTHPAMTDRSR